MEWFGCDAIWSGDSDVLRNFFSCLFLFLSVLYPVDSAFEVVASGWGSGRNSAANRIAGLLITITLAPFACRFYMVLFIYDFRFEFHELISRFQSVLFLLSAVFSLLLRTIFFLQTAVANSLQLNYVIIQLKCWNLKNESVRCIIGIIISLYLLILSD